MHALPEDVVRHAEGIDDGGLLLDHLEQAVVLDHDQRVDSVAKLVDAVLRLVRALASLESERPRDDSNGQRPDLLAELGDDRRAAGARATAFTGGDEDHVGTFQRFLQLVAALLRGGKTDLRIGTSAEATRDVRPNLDLDVGVRHQQRLGVSVHRDELDARKPGVDHSVDGIRAAAADADDLDHCEVVTGLAHHVSGEPGLKLE